MVVTLNKYMSRDDGNCLIFFTAEDGTKYTATIRDEVTLSLTRVEGYLVKVDFDSISNIGDDDDAMSHSIGVTSALADLHLDDRPRSPRSPTDERPSKKTRLGVKRRSARRGKKNKQKHTKRHRGTSKSRAHHHHHRRR